MEQFEKRTLYRVRFFIYKENWRSFLIYEKCSALDTYLAETKSAVNGTTQARRCYDVCFGIGEKDWKNEEAGNFEFSKFPAS